MFHFMSLIRVFHSDTTGPRPIVKGRPSGVAPPHGFGLPRCPCGARAHYAACCGRYRQFKEHPPSFWAKTLAQQMQSVIRQEAVGTGDAGRWLPV